MDKGRLVIEVEKDGDMLRNADVKISNLTLGGTFCRSWGCDK